MASIVQLKRSALSGKVPDTGSLNLGELAVNTYDGKIYFKKSGSIESVESIVTTNSTITGSIRLEGTASFGSLKVNDTLTVNHGVSIISGSLGVTSDLTVLGAINARQFNISVISSSILFESGSSKFGDTLDDIHSFTGSVNITGSFLLNGQQVGGTSGSFTGSFSGDGSGLRGVVSDDLPIDGWDYDSNSSASISEFNVTSSKYLIDFQWEQEVGTPIGFKTFISNTTGSTQIVPTESGIKFIVGNQQVALVGPNGIESVPPAGTVSGSSQLTSSYDSRYVLSGSITQTTWDNIASKPSGIVSGSSQVDVLSTTNISKLATTGSNTFVGTQTISGSILPAFDNTYDLGSTSNSWRDIYVSTASIKIVSNGSVVGTLSSNQNGDFNVSGQISASSISGIGNTNEFSTSVVSRLNQLSTKTGSIDDKFTTLGTYTGSQLTQNSSLATITGSLILTASNLTQRVSSIESISGTFATTGSNTFFGTQTFSGSLYVANDLIVQGSSSIQYISASSVSIGTNIIQLNTANPSVRFAGLTIIDSGSVGGSGSFLYDSVQDEFIFVHRGNGTNITSSHFVLGPETYDNLGNETYLTNNRIPKGTGKEHLNDSQITDDGNVVSISGALNVTGSVTASAFLGTIRATNGVVSGSSQVDVMSTTNIARLATTGSNTFVGNQIISGSLTTTGSITANNGNIQVGNITTNATLRISGDNSGGDTFINFQADSDAVKAQIQGSKNGATGGMIYLKTLQSGVLTTAVTVNQLGNTIFAGTITENSSLRYKENIETIKYGLDKVLQMRGVTYDKKDNGVREMGVIAEEVYNVLPEVVLKNEEGEIDSVSYSRIVGVLIEAIKDLKKEIEDLKANM